MVVCPAPLKNWTVMLSTLAALQMSSTPMGMVVMEARLRREDTVDFPPLKCTPPTPHRLRATRREVVFPKVHDT